MDRRTFLALLALPFVADLLGACGSSRSPAIGPAGVSNLKSSTPRVTTSADTSVASAAINAFAADMYARLVAAQPTANLVFSPASIALALAMTSAGAKGATLAQMDQVLHIADPAAIHRSMNGLDRALEATTKSKSLASAGGTGTQSVQLSIANSLWGQKNIHFLAAFLDLLAAEYGAGIELVDYRADPEKARVAINQWVQQQTKGRIPELLARGILTKDSVLTLVNAIYLKANWAEPFSESGTKPQAFATGDGRSVQVPMMHGGGEMPYAKGDGWQAVQVDYAFGDLGFVVAMGDTAAAAVPSSDEVFPALRTTPVHLGLPKFDIGSAVSLADTLQAMGMIDAFTDADFTGITTDLPLVITDVVHQANITVDEKGTEAAAATAVAVAGTAQPGPPVELTIDRPFTFWLREKATGAVVFMGRVNDPSAVRTA